MYKAQILRALTVAAVVAAVFSYSTADLSAGSAATQAGAAQARRLSWRPDFLSRADRCGVKETPADQVPLIEQAANGGVKDAGGIVTIPVYWHIITTSMGGGNVSARVADQMQVLNEAFAGSKFTFNLVNVEVIVNHAWYFAAAESADEIAMKTALRRGGPESLNIYTTNGDVYLGWATLPFYYKFFPNYDGVVLWWASLPGTGLEGPADEEPDGILTYDQGDTGTHEVGHWLGLDHTFAGGGCTNPGDKIKDTPTEAEPQFYCAPRDSCVGSPFRGDDPITNFMDYVDDVCMDNFTTDQTKRMRKHWHAFRDKKLRN